ncbi:Serine/Threonine-Protein Kinase Pim-1 [Manis pentadactyla]|nr:Serine/Threonine-Protein Kinase Pim-1 [Manis pentadactyla]
MKTSLFRRIKLVSSSSALHSNEHKEVPQILTGWVDGWVYWMDSCLPDCKLPDGRKFLLILGPCKVLHSTEWGPKKHWKPVQTSYSVEVRKEHS